MHDEQEADAIYLRAVCDLDLEAVRLVDHLSRTVGLRYYIVSSSCGSGALVLTEGAIFASF